MNNYLLVIGPSGGGKTAAGANLDPETTVWIVPEKKELPFPGSRKNYKTIYKENGNVSLKSNFIPENDMDGIKKMIEDFDTLVQAGKLKTKIILIDTLTYAMLNSVIRELANDNWNKFVMFADEFSSLINIIKNVKSPIDFIITSHVELIESKSTSDTTTLKKFKIPGGRFTKEKGEPEGLFTVVLYAECIERAEEKLEYRFRTQSGNGYPSKSPIGMFKDLYIPNDYDYVLKRFHEFYDEGIIEENKKEL